MANRLFMKEVEQMLCLGKQVVLRVKGLSMLPFIVGDEDSVELQKADMVKIGDIVLADIPQRGYVLHRIIEENELGVILMGDGNIKGCELCKREDIKGKVVRILKKNGRVVECKERFYRFKVNVWKICLPVRRYLLAMYKIIR